LPVSAFSIPNTQKENMNDKNAQRVRLETFEDFDNGLSDLIDLWSSADKKVTATIKDAALANFKEDLEEATLQWVDNKAKSKKYTAIAQELAEFEDALNQG
tara:strand:- start:24 stop:326 length:303 start_codon:yes stop_codon:yes gene_type:complete